MPRAVWATPPVLHAWEESVRYVALLGSLALVCSLLTGPVVGLLVSLVLVVALEGCASCANTAGTTARAQGQERRALILRR